MHGAVATREDAARKMLLEELGEAARAYRFEVAPNPCVGAAVLANGRVVARGYHEVWGESHAELNALAAAEVSGVPREEWDTLVVTLEPCSTSGKTPPCIDAIVQSGIGTVVVGEVDPDPRHRGRGLEKLRAAGLEVVHVAQASPIKVVAPHFLRWTAPERLRRRRPWTIVKWAQTLTGQLSPPKDVGEGRWISGRESRDQIQVLRGRVDAIVTGRGTVIADDPALTVRIPGNTTQRPLRVILDSYLRTPPEAKILAEPEEGHGAGAVHILCFAGADAVRMRDLEATGAKVHGLQGAVDKCLDLRKVQSWLWEQGVRRLLVEAGPRLIGSYFESGFIDQIRVYTGSVRGGRGESLGARLAEAKLLERCDDESGDDSVLEAFLAAK